MEREYNGGIEEGKFIKYAILEDYYIVDTTYPRRGGGDPPPESVVCDAGPKQHVKCE